MRKFLILLITTFCASATFAQSIKGKVTDAKNAALPGVSVLMQGTNTGTVTDGEGNFELAAGAGNHNLVVSFIGFTTKTVPVSVKTGVVSTVSVSLSESSEVLSEIVVTGSRSGGRSRVDSPVPVDVISAKELKSFSQVDVGQILNYIAPSFNSNKQTITDGTDHVDPASLRGLGPDQVLVLVNGKRRHNSALININGSVGRGSVGTDMNVIPVAAIERIEVLRDGAAAQYGSDAIAGVINIVLKKDYQGLSASVTTGTNLTNMEYKNPNINGGYDNKSQKITDGGLLQFDLSKGFRLGKEGYLTVSGQANNRQRTNRSGDDNAPTIYLGGNGSFPATPVPTGQTAATADQTTAFRKTLLANDAAYVKERGYDRHNMVFGNSASHNYGVFLNGGMPTGKTSEFYFTAGLTHRTGTSFGNYRIPVARTQQPLKADGSLYYPDGFLPQIGSIINDQSLLAGYKMKIGEWNASLSNTFGRNSFQFKVNESGNASLPNTNDVQTSFDAGTMRSFQNTTNLDLSKHYEQAGPIKGLNVAAGAEFRVDSYETVAGEANSYGQLVAPKIVGAAPLTVGGAANGTATTVPGAQVFPGFSNMDAIKKSRNNIGVYGDLEGEMGPLLVGVAGRYEHYSDFGGNFSGKVSARVKVTDAFVIRGSASTGFRAPSLQQRYFQNTSTQFVNGLPSNTLTINNDNPIARQVIGVDALKPETSLSFTVGATVKAGKAFTLTADAYQIDINDRIVYSGSFSAALLKLDPVAYNGINVVRFFANAIDTRTRGIDIVATERLNLGKGKLTLSLASNFNKTKVTALNSTPLIDSPENNLETVTPNNRFRNLLFDRQSRALIENYQPRSKVNISATYSIGRFDITARAVRFGKVKSIAQNDPYALKADGTRWNSQYSLDEGGTANIDQTFAAVWVSDLTISYKLSKSLFLAVGANNLFDVYPQQVFIDPRNAYGTTDYLSGRDNSNRGRNLFLSNQGAFNGRFVFTKLSFTL